MAKRRKLTAKQKKARAARNRAISRDPVALSHQIVRRSEVLRRAGKFDDAYDILAPYREQIGHTEAYLFEIGMIYMNRHQLDEAEQCLNRAIQLNSTPAKLSQLAFVHHQRGDYVKAVGLYRQSLKADADQLATYINLSMSLEMMGLFEEAEAALQIALKLQPGDPKAIFALSNVLLAKGDLVHGPAMYDAGFGCKTRHPAIDVKENYWRGEDISDKTIVVWREYGVGDEIRNASLFPDLIDAAGKVVIECEKRLVPLFGRSFPEAEVIAQVNDGVSKVFTERPDFDVHIGQASLMQFFRDSLDKFPRHTGYLTPDPERVRFWRARLEGLGGKLAVGICWRSKLMLQTRIRQFLSLEAMADILRTPDVAFVNLFYGECADELEDAGERLGLTIHNFDDIDLLNDLDEVAALTRALDLVITASTSVFDMGGAVGTETWTFVAPHHREMLGTDHVPWFPSVRVFEKRKLDPWGPVLAKVKRELDTRLAEDAAPQRRAAG